MLEAIALRPAGDRYQVVDGERRLRAAKLLGWTSIQAVVEELSDLDAAIRTLVANEQRQDISPLERARGYQRLNDPPFGLSHDDIAKRVGVDRAGRIAAWPTSS